MKRKQRDDSDEGLFRFLFLGLVRETIMQKVKLITLIMLVSISFSCHKSEFKQEDLDKLQSKNKCEKCDLRGVNLVRAGLSQAKLSDAKLNDANLINANLNGADLSQATLSEANLSKAKLVGAILCHTIMPDGKEKNLFCKK